MIEDILSLAEDKMNKTLENTKQNFSGIRTGRANPALLDRITVEYYGTQTPLKQLAGISVPENRLIVIQPYDKSILPQIEKAIQTSDLGLNPASDKGVIRLTLPELSEERRKELVKVVKKSAEDSKVAIRNIRREMIDMIKKEKEGVSEDTQKMLEEKLQKLTDKFIEKIMHLVTAKEAEVMEV